MAHKPNERARSIYIADGDDDNLFREPTLMKKGRQSGDEDWGLLCPFCPFRSDKALFLALSPRTALQMQSHITHHTVKLYVGNISFTVAEADLHRIFEQYGSVTEIKVVTDRETGQPRGFAFVTMSDDAEGRAAIKGLDGKVFGGRPLKISEARPKEDRPTGSHPRPRR